MLGAAVFAASTGKGVSHLSFLSSLWLAFVVVVVVLKERSLVLGVFFRKQKAKAKHFPLQTA